MSLAIRFSQIRGRTTAPQLATLQDGNAIAEHLCLIKMVSGKDQCATCIRKISACLQNLVSRETHLAFTRFPLTLREHVSGPFKT